MNTMHPAKGDQKPCTSAGCAGTMQFGRESANHPARAAAPGSADPTGWICSDDPAHFFKAD